MKRIASIIISLALLLASAYALYACSGNEDMSQPWNISSDSSSIDVMTSFDNSSQPLSRRLGITCWGSLYMPDLEKGENSLLRGANHIRQMGSRVIKVACGNLSSQYPLDDWSGVHFERSVDIFRNDIFVRLFEMDFDTLFICVSERKGIRYVDGVSQEEYAYVENEFYLMTKYLLETYTGSGKTFILQNWETDNAVGYSLTNTEDDIFSLRSYADYINARQDGINRARNEFVMSKAKNVYVFGAIEINKLDDSYTRYKAVEHVVPYTYCDLYSYSSYEYKDKGIVSSAEDVAARVAKALRYYESKLPSPDCYPQPVYFGDSRLAITEFGYPDRADGYSGEWQKMVVEGHLMAMSELSLQYVVYWQLCCNEPFGEHVNEIKNMKPSLLREYELHPGDINGFYLIRPDGEATYTYYYLKEVIAQNSIGVKAELPKPWILNKTRRI